MGGGGGGGIEAVLSKRGPKGATNMKFIYKCILQGGGGFKGGEICRKDKKSKNGGEERGKM